MRILACSEDMIPDAIEEVFPGTREAGVPKGSESIPDEDGSEDEGYWEYPTMRLAA